MCGLFNHSTGASLKKVNNEKDPSFRHRARDSKQVLQIQFDHSTTLQDTGCVDAHTFSYPNH